MRRGYWMSGLSILGVSAVFAVRTLTADREARADDRPAADAAGPAYTDREMTEYRYRANMPRHWRQVVMGR